MTVRAFRTFKQFREAGEGIATNILADRLRKLEAAGIVAAERDPVDRRRITYRLTEKGIGLAPVLLELLIWGAQYEEPTLPLSLLEGIAKNREQMLAEVQKRWKERDPNPLQVNGEWRMLF